jgi:hypothetical protein
LTVIGGLLNLIVNSWANNPSNMLIWIMLSRFIYTVRFLLFFLCANLMLPLHGAENNIGPASTDLSATADEAAKLTAPTHLAPGSNDWRIANITAQALERRQYLQMHFDAVSPASSWIFILTRWIPNISTSSSLIWPNLSATAPVWGT